MLGGQISRFGVVREKIKGEDTVHLVKILIAFPLKLLICSLKFLIVRILAKT